MTAMLDVKNIEVAYGKIVAVKDVSLSVNKARLSRLLALTVRVNPPLFVRSRGY